MSLASLDTIPRSQGTGHLPYAQVSTSSSLVAYDVPPQAPKPTVKKKRKRPDARQLDALNTMYARTRYPPTAEREQLARDLNMGPRTVQVWLVHLCLNHMYNF
jgi:homeobox protein YOX1/YHP1